MAFSDPQTVTINAVAQTLNKVSNLDSGTVFSKDDGNVKLTVTHAYGKRTRRQIRLDYSKIAADPLVSAQNIKYSMSTYLVVDVPTYGFTVAEAKQVVDALTAYLTASTGANTTKVLNGEI